jgi:hypothetical protein
MRGSLRTFCGGRVHHLRGRDGVARHDCRYAARLRYLRRDAYSTGGSRRSGAAAWRMGPSLGDSAGGVFREEPVVAPMSPSMRSASLNASRSFPVLPLLLGERDWLPWAPTRAAADPGWPHLSRWPPGGHHRIDRCACSNPPGPWLDKHVGIAESDLNPFRVVMVLLPLHVSAPLQADERLGQRIA